MWLTVDGVLLIEGILLHHLGSGQSILCVGTRSAMVNRSGTRAEIGSVAGERCRNIPVLF